MAISAPLPGLTALAGLFNGQHMLRYAVGASFVCIAAASVVALDDQRAWFHKATAIAATESPVAPATTTADAQPEIVFDRVVTPPAKQFAAADGPLTDATIAPVTDDPPPPVQAAPVPLPQPVTLKPSVAPKSKELPALTMQQSTAPVFDNLLSVRQMLNHGDFDHAKAVLVFLEARLGHESAREDVTVAKTMLGDAVQALDAGDGERAVHKVNVATTCFTVHCPPPDAR